jgi:hypothetical protein
MLFRKLLIAAATTLTSTSVLAAQTPTSAALSAVTDCRAGCQGGEGNCQQSTQNAVFTAADGYHLLAGSQTVIKHWNASDSPGLRAEPKWIVDSFVYEGKLLRATIHPDLSTCVGVSPHTQGVTFYEFQMLQHR